MPRFAVVSLFSGCGGLDLGFVHPEFETVLAVDSDPHAVRVYNANMPHRVAECIDVRSSEFRRRVAGVGSCDVVLGGFPCQGFSKAGPKRELDDRNLLYFEMLEAVKLLKPQVFLAENVDGLSQNFSGRYLHAIRRDFGALGYHVYDCVVDAASYGVPQHRRRILFVGVPAGSTFAWPLPSHAAPKRNGERALDPTSLWHNSHDILLPHRSISTAISDLLDVPLGGRLDHEVTLAWPSKYVHIMQRIGEGQKLCNVRHADSSVHTWDIPDVFGPISHRQTVLLQTISRNRRHRKYGSVPNGNPLPVETIEELSRLSDTRRDLNELVDIGYLKISGSGYDLKGAMFCSGMFKRPLWNAPSPTVLTNFHSPRYFLHPKLNRPFTLRECARLQGFPDAFDFLSSACKSSLIDGYRLVGNAVPPPLALRMANAVLKVLEREEVLTVNIR